MFRRVEIVCAAVLLAAGCASSSFLVALTGSGGKPQVIAGSVDQVSANLQAVLGRVGVSAQASRDGEDVRIAGTTKSGKKFAIVLHRQLTDSGEKTAVSVQWEQEADEQFWLSVVQGLTGPPGSAPAPQYRTPGAFGPGWK
jgi:hypothetical protein